MLLANDGLAQKTGVKNVFVSVKASNPDIKSLFAEIESSTSFVFNFDESIISNSLKLELEPKRQSLYQLLTKVSQQTELRFRRVNENIYVMKKLRSRQSAVEEVIGDFEQISISGKVSSTGDNEPLPGVSIIIKGTSTGTTTDLDGNYRISATATDVLQFSYIGFETREIAVGNQTVINVSLDANLSELEEVVVIGFGERAKKDLTGSITTVGAETIEKMQMTSPQFALQGNTTGVRVVNASGNPNEAPQIFVRGVGTWNGDSQPLYVIDGQIIEQPRAGNQDLIGGAGLSTPPNLFNLINPNDIESISVLKDASAAAIYGSRAANGVVLITTRRGKTGAPRVELNSRFGVQNIPTYNMLNTQQFVDIAQEMYGNNLNPDISIEQNLFGRNEPNDAVRLSNFSPQFDPQSPFFINNRTSYDWQNDLVNSNAINHNYDVKVSGASDKVDYYVSASYNTQEGMIYGNDLTRYTGAMNLNIRVTDWLKLGLNYKYTHQESNLNATELPNIIQAAPWQPLRDPSHPTGYAPVLDPFRFGDTWIPGKIYGQGSRNNYLAITDLQARGFTIDRNLGQFYAEFSPIKGLTMRGSLNLDYTQQERFSFDPFSVTNFFKTNGRNPREEAPNAPNSLGRAERRINNIYNYQADFMITYDRLIAQKHRVTLTTAVQDQVHRRETVNLSSENLNNIRPEPKFIGFGNDLANNSSFYGWDQRFWFGYVGRLSYNFDSKYYLDLSYRRDASNGFDRDFRWGNFYAASGAWRISSEQFMQNIGFISDLKIRAGWGQAGNDQAAVGQYAFLSGVGGALSSYSWGSGNGNALGNLNLGSLVSDFPNASLSWEVVTTTSLGFDAMLFNNKIDLTVEWYLRETDGILQRVNLPWTVGTNDPLFNIGKLENRGVDLQVGWNDKIGTSFNYNISGNISFVQNEVTRLYQDQPISTPFGRVELGRAIGHIWGYQVGGIFQTQDEIDAYFAQFTDQTIGNIDFVAPGDMYFLDVQGNPTETERFYSLTPDGLINNFDQTFLGNTIPGFTYGLNLNASWKGIDFFMGFYGEGDVKKVNSVRQTFESMSGAGVNFFATTLDRWTPNNRNTDMPRAVVGDPAGNNRFSDRWVESAAFFRLNNWQIGYTLPQPILDKFNNTVQSFRIFVGGSNNLYLSRWRGIDPINDEFPLPRSYNAGLTARF